MEAKDLMVGDLIKTNSTSWSEDLKDKYCKVTFLAKNYVSSISVDGSQKEPYGEGSSFDPILLTQEILEKNGFRKSVSPPGIHAKCYEIEDKDKKYCLTIANYNRYKRLLLNVDSEDSECFNIKCDYVHELQHALKMCGIEKEIIL